MEDILNGAVHESIDWWAVLVAGLAGFAVGGLWFSKLLFARPWMKEMGFSEADAKQGDAGRLLGGAALLTVLCAYPLARLAWRGGGWEGGLKVGLLVGSAVAFAMGVDYLFERRSLRLWLITGGHQLVTFTVMGTIIGAWR